MRRRTNRSVRRANLFRKKGAYPELDPCFIADYLEGGCVVYIIKTQIGGGGWRIEFQVQLKIERQVRDHDYNRDALRRGLWVGFETESASQGWMLSRADIRESTLTLAAFYRPDDLKRLQALRRVRIAHPSKNPAALVSASIIEVRDLKMIGPGDRAKHGNDVPF